MDAFTNLIILLGILIFLIFGGEIFLTYRRSRKFKEELRKFSSLSFLEKLETLRKRLVKIQETTNVDMLRWSLEFPGVIVKYVGDINLEIMTLHDIVERAKMQYNLPIAEFLIHFKRAYSLTQHALNVTIS